MDTWVAIDDERRALADDLTGLDAAQWDVQSLCDRWRARDCVGHVVSGSTITFWQGFGGLVRHGFGFDEFMAEDGLKRGAADPDVLLEQLRGTIGRRSRPSTAKPEDLLTDTLCHSQDVRRPLGIARDFPHDTLRAVADRLKGNGLPFKTKTRIAGLRLGATDADRTHGDGEAVEGTLEALVMAMAGRAST